MGGDFEAKFSIRDKFSQSTTSAKSSEVKSTSAQPSQNDPQEPKSECFLDRHDSASASLVSTSTAPSGAEQVRGGKGPGQVAGIGDRRTLSAFDDWSSEEDEEPDAACMSLPKRRRAKQGEGMKDAHQKMSKFEDSLKQDEGGTNRRASRMSSILKWPRNRGVELGRNDKAG